MTTTKIPRGLALLLVGMICSPIAAEERGLWLSPPDPPSPPAAPAPPAPPVPPVPPPPPQLVQNVDSASISRIDDLVDRYEALERFSGVILLARDGRVIYERAVGSADRENNVPNHLDTRFNIGSLTKQFTAAAILKLESEGRLSVNDPIVTHLPEYPRPQGELVTLHHLMSMSSGIPSLWRRGDGLDEIEETPEPVTLWEQISFSKDRPLLFEPGETYRYSNSNYIILAEIIERVSGMRWKDYLEQQLFRPARMLDTFAPGTTTLRTRSAHGHIGYPPEIEEADLKFHPSWGRGAGGVWTTARDLFRWSRTLDRNLIFSPEQTEKFFAHHTDWRDDGYYAYGWWGYELHGRKVLNHGGTIEGYVSEMHILPGEGLVAVALTNYMPRLGANMAAEVAEKAIAIALREPVDLPPMPAATTSDPADLVGRYQFANGHAVDVELEAGTLQITAMDGSWSPFRIPEIEEASEETPAMRRALEFLDHLRRHEFGRIPDMLFPAWRSEATAEDFREPWNRWTAQHGAFVGVTPLSIRKGRLTSVNLSLGFSESLAQLEVVLNDELEVAGWWKNEDVPQRTVELTPDDQGQFFINGFRWRNDDLRVTFDPASGPAATITIGKTKGTRCISLKL